MLTTACRRAPADLRGLLTAQGRIAGVTRTTLATCLAALSVGGLLAATVPVSRPGVDGDF
jgi:hypothetical protein